MKRVLSILILITCFGQGFGQNTFPATGNVGIGTTTPSVLFEVNGPSILNGLKFSRNNTVSSFYIGGNGAGGGTGLYNIGIGDFVMLNSTGNDNVVIGRAAGQNISSGNSNTFLGRMAGYKNTTASYNSAFGSNSLSENLIGNYNVAIGQSSMLNAKSASRNIAIGYLAGANLATGNSEVNGYNLALGWETLHGQAVFSVYNIGYHNTSMGYRSMFNNRQGSFNFSAGHSSMLNNLDGNHNISIGYLSLSSNLNKGSNISFGNEAMRYYKGDSVNTATYNIALGASAIRGNSIEDSKNTGIQNVAIGVNALLKNESGSGNLAVLNGSLASNLSGMNNISLGYASLGYSKAQNYNIAIGHEAMRFATDTVNSYTPYNVAIGFYALRGNTLNPSLNKGSANIALGAFTLYKTTSGGANVAIGYTALGNNEVGRYNSAIGYLAMAGNISGERNTAIGMQAGQFSNSHHNVYIGMYAGVGIAGNLNSGGYNTAVGYDALRSIQGTGQQNVAIGQSAGYHLTTGIQNTLIGRQTGHGLKQGNGNTIIGANVVGLDSLLNNTLILATANGIKIRGLENGNVGIGTNNPIQKLHVSGVGTQRILVETTNANDAVLDLKTPDKTWQVDVDGNSSTSSTANSLLINESDNGGNTRLIIQPGGNIGVGTITPKAKLDVNGSVAIGFANNTNFPSDYKLAVDGNIIAEKVKVKNSLNWPDFVFDPHYKLPDLFQIESFVKQNKHLPEIPSAIEIERDGQDLGEMNRLLLKKVEELTLYMIEMKKENDKLKLRLDKLER